MSAFKFYVSALVHSEFIDRKVSYYGSDIFITLHVTEIQNKSSLKVFLYVLCISSFYSKEKKRYQFIILYKLYYIL